MMEFKVITLKKKTPYDVKLRLYLERLLHKLQLRDDLRLLEKAKTWDEKKEVRKRAWRHATMEDLAVFRTQKKMKDGQRVHNSAALIEKNRSILSLIKNKEGKIMFSISCSPYGDREDFFLKGDGFLFARGLPED